MAIEENLNSKDDIFNPFPGLRPFKMDESHLFFGREGQSGEILRKLADNKFVAVIGASGSGKSSLIYCGLIPALYGGFIGDEDAQWNIITARPGNAPIDNLAAAILQNTEEAGDEDFIMKRNVFSSLLRSNSNGLVETLEQTFDFKKENLLIMIDQFEELFRYKSAATDQTTLNESEAFVKLLVTASEAADVPVYIVITMRSDFIGECSQFYQLTELINDSNYLVPQMTRDDFRKAIEGPVAVGGAEIDMQLVQQLLNEMGDDPDQLPILQHALMRTWDYWMEHSDPNKPITIADYEAVGKMEQALSEHANEAYDELNENQKWICEIIFKTITDKGSDNRGIRQPSSIAEIASIAGVEPQEIIPVIEPFREAGRSFVTPAADVPLDKSSIIDLSHESLMRIWNRLKIWVEEEWNAVQMYLRLSEAAEMYQLGKTGLWRPPDLQMAINWREKQKPTLDWAKRYNPAFERAMVYLKTSEKEFKAEEENKIKLQKRQLRRSKIFAAILGSAAIIGIGLTVYSQMMKARAQEQERIAMEEKQKADKQKEIAEEQTIIAKQQEELALEQKEMAEEQKLLAESNEDRALRNAELAERQRQIALRRQQEANEQRSLAEKNAEEARKQQTEAEKARQEALRRRMLSIAQSMAVKSQQISDNTQLKALVAYQAYDFNEQYNGPKHNPDVYLGLHYALKALEGQSFNALNGHTGSVMDISFIPGKDVFFTTGGDGKILKWNLDDKPVEPDSIASNPFVQRSLTVTPDGKYLICATDAMKILVFDIKQDLQLVKELTGHSSFVTGVVVAPDDSYFISFSNDKTILKWDLKSFTSTTLLESDSRINALAISPDTEHILVATQDGGLTRYAVSKPDEGTVLLKKDDAAITSVAYNNSGSCFACGDSKGNVVVWDAEKTVEMDNLEGHRSRIYDIAFSPNDKLLATSSLDGTVRLWDCENLNNQPIELRDHESWVFSVTFSPDGSKLITSSKQKERILIWSTLSGELAEKVGAKLQRNMTEEEWNAYVAKDIEYEETIP